MSLFTIEAEIVMVKGKHNPTGQLGDVMKESIQAAMTVVRSRANVLGHRARIFIRNDIHITCLKARRQRRAKCGYWHVYGTGVGINRHTRTELMSQ